MIGIIQETTSKYVSWKSWKWQMTRSDQASEVVENHIRDKEGERILKHIKEDDLLLRLRSEGNYFLQREFAGKIEKLRYTGDQS